MQGIYYISGSVYTNIVSNAVLVTHIYIQVYSICDLELPDS